MRYARHVRAAVAAGALALSACKTGGYNTKPRVEVVEGDPIVAMTKPGSMPSLEHPTYVPVKKHTDPPFRDEKVLGVALGAPRMYPIGLLDTYEVINEEDAGTPYVVARCALTDFTGALDRRVAGRTLTFENSGALWRDMLMSPLGAVIMVAQMDAEGFGSCTNHFECEAACPKEISVEWIARLYRDYMKATLTRPADTGRGEGGVG